MKKESVSRIFFALLFAAMCITQATPLAAQHRRGEERVRGRAPVVVNLPAERTRVIAGGREYFYTRGIFYRPGPRGYIVTRGPIGARVRMLPPGYVTLQIGGGPFFFYYGTYYRLDPARRDYVVVAQPEGAPAPPTMDRINMADGRMIEGTYVGGNASVVQINVDGTVQEIPIDQIVSIEFAPPSQ
jgi:hypothetical protein